jgi:hypothetical protein
MKRKTESIRVRPWTRWALKLAGARLDCSIIEVLARVERGDRKALAEWQRAAREISN